MPPWHHPCFINMSLEILFTCGRKIVRTKDGVCRGKRGRVIKEIYVMMFADALLFRKIDETTIVDIFCEQFDVDPDTIYIMDILSCTNNSLTMHDYFSINDMMI